MWIRRTNFTILENRLDYFKRGLAAKQNELVNYKHAIVNRDKTIQDLNEELKELKVTTKK